MGESWFGRMFPRARSGSRPGEAARTRALADAGDRDAQYAMGMTYACETGERQDFEQARVWLRRAAEQDHALAQFNLGCLYARGDVEAGNDAEAAVWMRRAADQGDAGAQFFLGVRCQRAIYTAAAPEVSEARIEAYKWFELASRQGYGTAARSVEFMNLGMSTAELAEGERRVASLAGAHPVPEATD